ncbi:MAG: 8-oxo-dGTP diphosphatase MutT [Gammaproteobacteria bacterium]|nr:8-oxo-dGTP diphosphatase MutT [Gammaproteobacteria bacterium]
MKHFHVAAGILRDNSGRVLITERLCDGPFNGLWEFPGGKIVAGESPLDALRRELAEELGIEVTSSLPFMDLHHEYPDRTVDLEFFLVTAWQGEPQGLESQGLRWITTDELDADVLLPADKPVVQALQVLGPSTGNLVEGSKAQHREP